MKPFASWIINYRTACDFSVISGSHSGAFAVAFVTVVLLFVEVSLVSDMQQCSTMIYVELESGTPAVLPNWSPTE
jgi:hypothetical protein